MTPTQEPRVPSVWEEEALPEGTVVEGRYEVIHVLARGGMSIVYRARALATEDPVALKIVSQRYNRADTNARYQNDLRISRHLEGHPSFARPLEAGQLSGPSKFAGRIFLATELIDGQTIEDIIIKGRKLSIGRACSLARGIADALAHLHSSGIVHRDIKPANVIVRQGSEDVVLIDLGLAYATGDGWLHRSPELTLDGQAPGTLLYMSPEQSLHERPTPAFDVYSLGVSLYEILTGTPPFDGCAAATLAAKKLDPTARPLAIGRLRPEVPGALVELVDRCMAYDPGRRPDAAHVVKVLGEIAAALPSSERRTPAALNVIETRPAEQTEKVLDQFAAREAASGRGEADTAPMLLAAPAELGGDLPKAVAGTIEDATVIHCADGQSTGGLAPLVRTTMPMPATQELPKHAVAEPLGTSHRPSRTRPPFFLLAVVAAGLVLAGVGLAFTLHHQASGTPSTALEPVRAAISGMRRPHGPREPVPELTARHSGQKKAVETENPAPLEEVVEQPKKKELSASASQNGSAGASGSTAIQEGSTHARHQASPNEASRPSRHARSEPSHHRAPTAENCEEKRRLVEEHRASASLEAILPLTRRSKCWQPTERQRLRVMTLKELGRYRECASEGSNSEDKAVVALAAFCRNRAQR